MCVERDRGTKSFREFLRSWSVTVCSISGDNDQVWVNPEDSGRYQGIFLVTKTSSWISGLQENGGTLCRHFGVTQNYPRSYVKQRVWVLSLRFSVRWFGGGGVLVICILRSTPNESDVGGLHHWRDITPIRNTISKLDIHTDILCACTYFKTAYKQANIANKEIEE